LQFVVITLIADLPMPRGQVQAQASNAFATPTVVHFSVVLLLSAIASAPWHGVLMPAVLWDSIGIVGFAYQIVVVRRMRTQALYKPQLEDWMFHGALPFAAYIALAISAHAALRHFTQSIFGVAAASLLLLFIGIHNAWDAITYHVYFSRRPRKDSEHPV
jgi:hypothetical protein